MQEFLPRHSLGGGIAKLVALQLPVQSRPMTIAFAAPGVQYSARVLLGHTSRDRNIQLRQRPGRGLKNLDLVLVILVESVRNLHHLVLDGVKNML